jgi:hypothetical protein
MKAIKFAALFAIVATLSACAGTPTKPYASAKVQCEQAGGAWNSSGAGHCYTAADKQSGQVMLNMYTQRAIVANNVK